MKVALRPCALEDSALLLDWRNSLEVESIYQVSKVTSPASHIAWLRQRLLRLENEPFWIIIVDNEPAGYIRLDSTASLAKSVVVSIFVFHKYRGLGVGQQGLEMTIASFRKDFEYTPIFARVHMDNLASIKLFQKSGFKMESKLGEFHNYKLSFEHY
jgi:RimJ/RimL family protein N-acetyltransferase